MNNISEPKKYYSISEFAKRINVSISTLRNWDKSGFLKPHHKTDGGHRLYSEEQAKTYLNHENDSCVKQIFISLEETDVVSFNISDSITNEDIELICEFLKNIYKIA